MESIAGAECANPSFLTTGTHLHFVRLGLSALTTAWPRASGAVPLGRRERDTQGWLLEASMVKT